MGRTRLTWLGLTAAIGTLIAGCGVTPTVAHAPWLILNPATRTARMLVVMDSHPNNPGNLGLNFDDYSRGGLVFRIPQGYHVTMVVRNDGGQAYSAGIYNARLHLAFPGAGIPLSAMRANPDNSWIMPGQTVTYHFTATTPGTYKLASLLFSAPSSGKRANHLFTGMWDTVKVTPAT
ncbi:MAG: hypothetical protein OWV35_11640 [Firmicutes bacterium]|nr:hypothetical protein [Bacillota bacterium]